MSKGGVVNYLRTDLLECYPWLLVQVEYYTCVQVEGYMIHNLNRENKKPWPFGHLSLAGGFGYGTAQLQFHFYTHSNM